MKRFDLNLIYVFQVLYSVRNLTRASEILCITQPATSNALKRLRSLLGDPLFIRSKGGMEPTAKARAIANDLQKGLNILTTCIEDTHTFNPLTAERCFRFIISDIVEAMTLPTILHHAMKVAPNVAFEVYHCNRNEISQELAAGRADIAFDSIPPNDPHLKFKKLFSDRYVCIMNKSHPLAKSKLDLSNYISSDHVHAFSKMRSFEHADIDLALQKLNLQRRIEMRTQHHLTVPYIVAQTYLLGSVPAKSADLFSKSPKTNILKYRELPFEVPNIEIYFFWHDSADFDNANRWMRNSLIEYFND